MRGKVVHFFGAHLPDGITPAYAGKSSQTAEHPSIMQDHPRVCGEKSSPTSSHRKGQGSPPRMRGKADAKPAPDERSRITPAYAGKSQYCVLQVGFQRDHPRVCGEKPFPARQARMCRGSPPRMRGKVTLPPWLWLFPGITPAYAGKRLKRSHRIGHFSCILCLFHSVLHRASASGGSRAGPCAPPCLPAQNAVPV